MGWWGVRCDVGGGWGLGGRVCVWGEVGGGWGLGRVR